MECVVYKITSPSGKIYIGSTINKNRRLYEYLNNRIPSQHKLKSSFEKYGFKNHKIEILWTGDKAKMLEMECKFGKQFNVLDRKTGLNLKLPCYGEKKYTFSNEVLEKMKKARLGKPSYWNNKEISSYSLNGDYLRTFKSIKEAAKFYNLIPHLIRNVLKGRGKRSKNMRFKYGNSKENIGTIQLRKATKYNKL